MVDIPNNPRRNISLAIMDYSASVDNTKEMSFKYTLDGDAGIDFDGSNSFTDILLPKIVPPKFELLKAIVRRKLDAIFRL